MISQSEADDTGRPAPVKEFNKAIRNQAQQMLNCYI